MSKTKCNLVISVSIWHIYVVIYEEQEPKLNMCGQVVHAAIAAVMKHAGKTRDMFIQLCCYSSKWYWKVTVLKKYFNNEVWCEIAFAVMKIKDYRKSAIKNGAIRSD